MTNEITTKQQFNETGDLIVAEAISGGSKTQTIKYGLIKLMGERTERRVSFRTLCDIEQSRKQGFDGNITITELGMSVRMSQIVMLRSEVENKVSMNNFTSLLCESVVMDENNGQLYVSDKSRAQHATEQQSYWQCVVHYRLEKGEKIYLTEFDKIKRAVHIIFEDGYEIAKEIYEYGVKKSQ